jgi:hypothetical protein
MEAAASNVSALGNPRATGLAVLRVYANLRAVPPGAAHANLDATWRAGRAADLALRIRRQGSLPYAAVRSFGELIALSPKDLVDWALPGLTEVEVIDYSAAADGTPILVEERVGVAAPVLD